MFRFFINFSFFIPVIRCFFIFTDFFTFFKSSTNSIKSFIIKTTFVNFPTEDFTHKSNCFRKWILIYFTLMVFSFNIIKS